MPLFRVTIKRTQYLEAVIEADDADDARDQGQNYYGSDWTDATGGRGLGDDDTEVLSVEQEDDDDDDDDDYDDGGM